MFQAIFRPIFVLSLLLISISTQAATVTGAGKYEYAYGYIMLSGSQPRIYLFKNISDQPILLDEHRRFDPGVSAGWASILAPGHWSAILLNRPSFTMNCHMKKRGGQYSKVCCKRRIQVVPAKQFTAKRSDFTDTSFWVTENKPCLQLGKHIKARGFQLKVPDCS